MCLETHQSKNKPGRIVEGRYCLTTKSYTDKQYQKVLFKETCKISQVHNTGTAPYKTERTVLRKRKIRDIDHTNI